MESTARRNGKPGRRGKAGRSDMSAEAKEKRRRRWRRWRLAMSIGLVEGVVAGLLSGAFRWTVVALAVAAIGLYGSAGRSARSRTVHDLLWIFALSQAVAVVVAALSFFFAWLAYAVAALLALVVVVLLLTDR
jgi:hypothetical protein